MFHSTLIHKTFIGRLCRVFSDVSHPNFDPVKLSEWIAARKFLAVEKIKLYTGVPSLEMDRHWHEFWDQKNAVLVRNKKVKIYTRETRVRKTRIRLDNGEYHEVTIQVEKGIDVRIAIDIVRDALDKRSENIVIFSQDQDLSEAVSEVFKIAKIQGRDIKIYSVFPVILKTPKINGGINRTEWVQINESDYNQCIDKRRYGI